MDKCKIKIPTRKLLENLVELSEVKVVPAGKKLPAEKMESLEEGRKKLKICKVEGCGRKHQAKGFCNAHWQRFHKGIKHLDGMPISKSSSKVGNLNPKWRGGEVDDGRGRILIYSPTHPFPNWCGTHVYRYRLVVEKHLGRFLNPKEIVHHKNGIVNDDRIENLEVMSQSEHIKIHLPEMVKLRKKI